MTFTKPSGWLTATALPEAVKGNLPIWYFRPLSLHARSVRPMLATCGWQYVQPGKRVDAARLAVAEHAVDRLHGLDTSPHARARAAR